MAVVLLTLRVLLSAVFGVAGFAKLLDGRATRGALSDFGVPAQFAGALALLLPLAEIAIAAGLLLPRTAWWTSGAALLLLVVFIVAIAFNLKRGRTPDCHCFGQLYSRPLGWPTLLRNIGFAAVAGFVIWQGPQALEAGARALSPVSGVGQYLPALVVFVILVAALIGHSRKAQANGEAANSQLSDQGLPVGIKAPEFDLPAFRREHTSLSELLSEGKPLMLIFTNPNCGPCVALFQEVAEWQRIHPEQLTIAIITQGTLKENFVNIARNSLENILFQKGREVAESYRAQVTPTAVVVTPAGKIGSGVAAGADAIRSLLYDTIGSQSPAVEADAEAVGELQPGVAPTA